ncbi:MAG TPA: tail fiber protein, partial [Acidobacteriaceae bacterium]|nr:tail fiber protein [Acidobacteriaceae bacterium]
MEAFIGTILPWPLSWAPLDWTLCQGQLLPLNQYQALYSLLGTVYGGDGMTTFGIPDLRCRLPLGAGTGPGLTARNPGDRGGAESVQLLLQNLPSHTHSATFTPGGGGSSVTLQASTAQGNATSAQGNY